MANFVIDMLVKGASTSASAMKRVADGVWGVVAAEEKLSKVQAKAERDKRTATGNTWKSLGKAGGALGNALPLGRVGEALSAPTAGMAALGLGAVAVGIAMNEFGAAMNRAAEEVRLTADIQNSLRDAIKGARDSANAGANAEASGMRKSVAALLGRGGPNGMAMAQDLARKVGPGGMEAAGTLARVGKFDSHAAAIVERAVATGLMTAEEAGSELAKRPRMGGRGVDDSVATLLKANGVRGVSGKDVGGLVSAYSGSQFGMAGQQVAAAEAGLSEAKLRRFSGGGTAAGIREETAAVSSPEAAATLQVFKAQQDQINVLRKIEEGQAWYEKIYDGIVNRGDSARNKYLRETRVRSNALMPER
jgi:hypothetical protein